MFNHPKGGNSTQSGASSGMIMSRYERNGYISGGYKWEIKNMRTNPIQQLENKIPGRQRKACCRKPQGVIFLLC